jgi:hypothetical protein
MVVIPSVQVAKAMSAAKASRSRLAAVAGTGCLVVMVVARSRVFRAW